MEQRVQNRFDDEGVERRERREEKREERREKSSMGMGMWGVYSHVRKWRYPYKVEGNENKMGRDGIEDHSAGGGGSITTRYTNIHILYGNECSVFPCTLHATEPSIGGVEYTTTPFGLSYVHPSTCEHSFCMRFALHFYFPSECIDMIFECELTL